MALYRELPHLLGIQTVGISNLFEKEIRNEHSPHMLKELRKFRRERQLSVWDPTGSESRNWPEVYFTKFFSHCDRYGMKLVHAFEPDGNGLYSKGPKLVCNNCKSVYSSPRELTDVLYDKKEIKPKIRKTLRFMLAGNNNSELSLIFDLLILKELGKDTWVTETAMQALKGETTSIGREYLARRYSIIQGRRGLRPISQTPTKNIMYMPSHPKFAEEKMEEINKKYCWGEHLEDFVARRVDDLQDKFVLGRFYNISTVLGDESNAIEQESFVIHVRTPQRDKVWREDKKAFWA